MGRETVNMAAVMFHALVSKSDDLELHYLLHNNTVHPYSIGF
jgi:hypothetical protein